MIFRLATVLFPLENPGALTPSSEKKAFQVHTGRAELEETHAPRICRISAATINRIKVHREVEYPLQLLHEPSNPGSTCLISIDYDEIDSMGCRSKAAVEVKLGPGRTRRSKSVTEREQGVIGRVGGSHRKT